MLQAHIPLHYADPYFGGVVASAYTPQAMVIIFLCLLGSPFLHHIYVCLMAGTSLYHNINP